MVAFSSLSRILGECATVHSLDSGRVGPLRHRWVKGVCVFRCNLLPALSAEWPGSFTCYCGKTGMERTPNKSQHRMLTLEMKIPLPLLPELELATFRSRVRRSNQQAIPATHPTLSLLLCRLDKTRFEKAYSLTLRHPVNHHTPIRGEKHNRMNR